MLFPSQLVRSGAILLTVPNSSRMRYWNHGRPFSQSQPEKSHRATATDPGYNRCDDCQVTVSLKTTTSQPVWRRPGLDPIRRTAFRGRLVDA